MPTSASLCDFLSTGGVVEPGVAAATVVRVAQRIRVEGALRHFTWVGKTVDNLCAIGACGSWEWGWGGGRGGEGKNMWWSLASESHKHHLYWISLSIDTSCSIVCFFYGIANELRSLRMSF